MKRFLKRIRDINFIVHSPHRKTRPYRRDFGTFFSDDPKRIQNSQLRYNRIKTHFIRLSERAPYITIFNG